MPSLDFKEIASAKADKENPGEQDTFELFAREVLELVGYHIVSSPDRGPDDGKDLIVEERRSGVGGETVIRWLVSCKHKAFSGGSVTPTDETNINDRLATNSCTGFLGFYSTLPSSGLGNIISAISESQVYDRERIEGFLLASAEGLQIVRRFFPASYENWNSSPNRAADLERMLSTIPESIIAFGTDSELNLDQIFVDASLETTEPRILRFVEGEIIWLPSKLVALTQEEATLLNAVASWCGVPIEIDYDVSPDPDDAKATQQYVELQSDAISGDRTVARLGIKKIAVELQSRLRQTIIELKQALSARDLPRWHSAVSDHLTVVSQFMSFHTCDVVGDNWVELAAENVRKPWKTPALNIPASYLGDLQCPQYIRGGPGAGKTTLLRYFGQQMCRSSSSTTPIFVSLARLPDAKPITLLEICIAQSRFPESTHDEFFSAAKRGDYVILLDGLDEFSASPDELLRTIQSLFLDPGGIQVVLTCRDTFITDPLQGALQFTLRPFTDGQIAAFIQSWFRAEPTLQKEVLDWLKENPSMNDTARTPMVLALLCSMVDTEVNLPSALPELYEGRFELLIERWDRAKGTKRLNRMEIRIRWRFLEDLAFENHLNRDHEMPYSLALEVAKTYLQAETGIDEAELVADCIRRGLLQHIDGVGLSFGHLTYQEYLAARKVATENEMIFLINNSSDPWWLQTLEFWASSKMDISPYVKALMATQMTERDVKIALRLAALAPLTDEVVLSELKGAIEYGRVIPG